MFKKTEYKLPPMSTYKSKILRDLSDAINVTKKYEIANVDLNKINILSLDKVTMTINHSKNPIEMIYNVDHSSNSEYFRGWLKGIGYFIHTDIKKDPNSNKYLIITYHDRNDEINNAFVRIVESDEIESDEKLEEMKEYHAIDIESKNNDGNTIYYNVMKIFPEIDKSYTFYDALKAKSLIVKDDSKWMHSEDTINNLVVPRIKLEDENESSSTTEDNLF